MKKDRGEDNKSVTFFYFRGVIDRVCEAKWLTLSACFLSRTRSPTPNAEPRQVQNMPRMSFLKLEMNRWLAFESRSFASLWMTSCVQILIVSSLRPSSLKKQSWIGSNGPMTFASSGGGIWSDRPNLHHSWSRKWRSSSPPRWLARILAFEASLRILSSLSQSPDTRVAVLHIRGFLGRVMTWLVLAFKVQYSECVDRSVLKYKDLHPLAPRMPACKPTTVQYRTVRMTSGLMSHLCLDPSLSFSVPDAPKPPQADEGEEVVR